jgi:autophagy-related protein 5
VTATAAESLLELAAAEGRLLVGGASPPLDAPLAWLHAHLHAGDYFLYAILHVHQTG